MACGASHRLDARGQKVERSTRRERRGGACGIRSAVPRAGPQNTMSRVVRSDSGPIPSQWRSILPEPGSLQATTAFLQQLGHLGASMVQRRLEESACLAYWQSSYRIGKPAWTLGVSVMVGVAR